MVHTLGSMTGCWMAVGLLLDGFWLAAGWQLHGASPIAGCALMQTNDLGLCLQCCCNELIFVERNRFPEGCNIVASVGAGTSVGTGTQGRDRVGYCYSVFSYRHQYTLVR